VFDFLAAWDGVRVCEDVDVSFYFDVFFSLRLLAGDFMQLSCMDGRRRVSLLKPLSSSDPPEHVNAVRMFDNIVTDVYFLRETWRFRDSVTKKPCPFLPRLFQYMRCPSGDLPADVWKRLQACVLTGPTDVRLKQERFMDGALFAPR
jgi:hypothetical protein